ncbi:MAG: RHS repeat-associated core domain-containing protein [Planctomycetaceae bacterium]|nr:RHS repeat-associated core domain-containing protein [Planctomycetaceae bacterium]
MFADPLHLSPHQRTPSPPPLSSSCSFSRRSKRETTDPCNHRNQQYSIIGLTNAAGTLVERYSYSAYGTIGTYAANGTVRTSSTYANRYTYTGREYDPDLNLYYFRARWYDPATGGFISRDPLGYVDGMSLYGGYFGLEDVDPSGLILRTQEKVEPKSSRVMDGWLKSVDLCRAARALKIKQDNEPDPPPICKICESNCQTQVAKAKQHQRVRDILDQFGPTTCTEPKISCITCKEGWGGQYWPHDKEVTICWNAYCADDTIDGLVTLLAHELTHALQDCTKPLIGRDCKYDLQAELEAYYCGKQCNDFDSCLQRAIESACTQKCYPNDLNLLYGELKVWFELRTTLGEFCHFPRPQFP